MIRFTQLLSVPIIATAFFTFAEPPAPQEQVVSKSDWKPAETAKDRKKQLQEAQDELDRSKETTATLFALAEGDEALLEANQNLAEYAASIAEEARMSNGRSGLPPGFYETRNKLIAEEQKALRAVLGETQYKTYTSELTKQQTLLRRISALRHLGTKPSQ